MRLLVSTLIAATVAATPPLRAQDAPVGAVTGRVYNAATGQPLEGAAIALVGTGLARITDASGHFLLAGVTPGVYRLSVRAIGYRLFVQSDVVVGSAKPYEVEIRLTPAPIRLEGVEVRPSFFRPPQQATASTRTLGAEDTRRAPGVNEDVVRAVALLPGVAVTNAGRNDLIVRGGAPFENLFVVDGIEIPNINHFGSQGSTGGPLSLINIDFVQETDFSAGGFGAKYGDRTASLTNIVLREGNDERVAGEVNLSATGFGAIAEGPLGSKGSFLLSARRSYLDLLFKAAGFSFVPAYWDFQLKTAYRPDRSNAFSFLAIGALDQVTFFNDDADDRFDNSRVLSPEQNQYFAGLRWQRFLSSGLLGVTLGRTFTRFRSLQLDSLDPPGTVFRGNSDEGESSLRVDLTLEPSARLTLNVGSVSRLASALSYDAALAGYVRRDAGGVPSPLTIDTSFSAFRTALYGEARYWLTAAVQLTAGMRAEYYGYLDGAVRLAPRLGLRLTAAPTTTVTLSAGQYYQPPAFIWLVGDPQNGAQLEPTRADQVVLGVERELRADTRVQLEVYAKRYAAYPARVFRPQAVLAPGGFEDVTTDIPFGLEPLESVGTGRAYGVELFVQKKLSAIPLYGLASVAVSRSEFTGLDGIRRPGAYDGRVIATTLLGYRFNAAWELNAKFRVASGLPTTPYRTQGPDAGQLDFTRYNAGPRLPLFHALDVRAGRRWSFRGAQLEVYLDVANVYGRENVSSYRWNARDGAIEADASLGILPSIGVNVEF